MISLAIVGAGVMGSNHARIAAVRPNVRITNIVDPDTIRAEVLAAHVGATAASSIEHLDPLPDAAIVATPSHLHRATAEALAAQGVHLLVEKPLAVSIDDAHAIAAAAEAAGIVLAVGHVERFNPAVLELGSIVQDPFHISATRISPYSPRVSESVVLDLMIHDLDIISALAGCRAVDVAATTQRRKSPTDDLVSAVLRFENGLTASVLASRIGQNKERSLTITQADSVISVDLLRQDVTIAKMHHAEYTSDSGTRYRQSGVIEIPFLERRGEPLALEQDEFLAAIEQQRRPLVDAQQGIQAVELALRVMAAAEHATIDLTADRLERGSAEELATAGMQSAQATASA